MVTALALTLNKETRLVSVLLNTVYIYIYIYCSKTYITSLLQPSVCREKLNLTLKQAVHSSRWSCCTDLSSSSKFSLYYIIVIIIISICTSVSKCALWASVRLRFLFCLAFHVMWCLSDAAADVVTSHHNNTWLFMKLLDSNTVMRRTEHRLGLRKEKKRSENDTQTCYMWGSEFGFNSEQNRHFLSEGLTNMNMTRSSWRKHFCRVMEGGRGSNMIWSLRSTGMKSSLSLYIFIFFFLKKKIKNNFKWTKSQTLLFQLQMN